MQILQSETEKFLNHFHQLLKQGFSWTQLLGALNYNLAQIRNLKIGIQQGKTLKELSTILKLNWYQVQKLNKYLNKWNYQQLATLVDTIMELDEQAKKGFMQTDSFFEWNMLKLFFRGNNAKRNNLYKNILLGLANALKNDYVKAALFARGSFANPFIKQINALLTLEKKDHCNYNDQTFAVAIAQAISNFTKRHYTIEKSNDDSFNYLDNAYYDFVNFITAETSVSKASLKNPIDGLSPDYIKNFTPKFDTNSVNSILDQQNQMNQPQRLGWYVMKPKTQTLMPILVLIKTILMPNLIKR